MNRSALAVTVAAMLSAVSLASAMAASLEVTVRGASGRPAPDVVVMLVPAAAAPAPAARPVDILQRGK